MTPEEFKADYGIDARILHEVEEIDPKNRRVLVKCLRSKKGWWEPYDKLLIATGALPYCPKVPGREAEGIFGLHSLQSGIVVREYVDRESPKKAVVVGGGYIGLEMAEALSGLEDPLDRTVAWVSWSRMVCCSVAAPKAQSGDGSSRRTCWKE